MALDQEIPANDPVDDALDAKLEQPGGSETVEESAPPSLADAFKHAGIDGVPDDAEKFKSEWQQYQSLRAQFPQLQQQHAYLMQERHRQAQEAAQRQQQEAAQKKEAAREKLFNIPKFDRRLMSQLETNENGQIVAKLGADPTIPSQYQSWRSAYDDAQDKLIEMMADPVAMFQEHIYPHIQEQIQQQAFQAAQQMMRQEQLQQKIAAKEQEYAPFLKDEAGNLKPWALRWNQNLQQAMQMGHADPVAYADAFLDQEVLNLHMQQTEREKAEAEAKKKANDKAAFLRNANKQGVRGPQRGGNKKSGTKTPNPDDAFAEMRERLSTMTDEELEEDLRSF